MPWRPTAPPLSVDVAPLPAPSRRWEGAARSQSPPNPNPTGRMPECLMNYNQLNHLHALSRLLDQADRLNTLADQSNLDGTTGPQVVDIAIGSRDTCTRRIDLMGPTTAATEAAPASRDCATRPPWRPRRNRSSPGSGLPIPGCSAGIRSCRSGPKPWRRSTDSSATTSRDCTRPSSTSGRMPDPMPAPWNEPRGRQSGHARTRPNHP